MRKQIRGLLCGIFVIVGVFIVFGGVGAYETDRVTFEVAVVECLIGAGLMVLGDIVLRKQGGKI